VGFAAAFYDAGAFVPGALSAYALCACLVIAWLNLSNDAWVRPRHADRATAAPRAALDAVLPLLHRACHADAAGLCCAGR
jgi:hypothetical protein